MYTDVHYSHIKKGPRRSQNRLETKVMELFPSTEVDVAVTQLVPSTGVGVDLDLLNITALIYAPVADRALGVG